MHYSDRAVSGSGSGAGGADVLEVIQRFKRRMAEGETMLGLTIILNDLRITVSAQHCSIVPLKWLGRTAAM